jgi:hypothetical protein
MCPWSGASLIGDRIRIRTIFGGHDAKSTLHLADEVFKECKLLESDGKNGTATTLLVFPEQTEFDDFLDVVAIAEGILEENNMTGLLQVAHFHPEYMFQGSKDDSIENYTNRSPYPTLHLIQVAEVTKAIESCKDGDTSFVWKKNIATVRKLGKTKIKELLSKIAEDTKPS